LDGKKLERRVGRVPAHLFYEGIPKFKKEKSSMTRRVPQRIVLLFVCTLALILIPVSYSAVWAQSTQPSTTQQDTTDRNDVNQNQSNPDQNQSNQDLNQNSQPSTDANSSTIRQKPSSDSDPNSENQNQNRNMPNQNRTDRNSTQTNRSDRNQAGSDNTQSSSDQNTDANATGNRKLPSTAGELPLLALIGLLSIGAVAITRVLARARSSH